MVLGQGVKGGGLTGFDNGSHMYHEWGVQGKDQVFWPEHLEGRTASYYSQNGNRRKMIQGKDQGFRLKLSGFEVRFGLEI